MNEYLRELLKIHRLHASMNICAGCDWRATPGAGSLGDQHQEHVFEEIDKLFLVRFKRPTGPDQEQRLTIYMNSNVSRGKAAAGAVHAALAHYGIEHGAVICLGSKPPQIEEECTSVIRDAGRTEVEPGTITAGVKEHITNQPHQEGHPDEH